MIGGLCFIESTLGDQGNIIQTSPAHELVFGERNGEISERITKIDKTFSGTKANFRLSETINQDKWHKYMFITALSGITTLMRSPIGPIREVDSGRKTISLLLNELTTIMKRIKAPISENIERIQLAKINEMGWAMKSSMLRDMEKTLSIEAGHLQGYLLDIAQKEQISTPVLETIYANLKVYEHQLALS